MIARARPLKGVFFRSVEFRFMDPDEVLSGAGAERDGGRFVPAGTKAIYLSKEDASLTMSALSSPFLFFCTTFLHTSPFTPKSGLPCSSVDLCIDDHGSLVIFRSASVRPKHLFDPYFDHDY